MARNEAPMFPRGSTYYNGGTIDTNNLGGTQHEGKEYVFEDNTYGTNLYVTVRIVRNVGAAALLPSRLVTFKAGYYGQRVDGYGTTTAQGVAGVVDEFLPSAGVPVNDLFYIVTAGPTKVLTDLAGAGNNVIAQGDTLCALTAATSGATTAGRGYAPLTGATAATTSPANVLQNFFGRAMSAATTANTNTGLLVFVNNTF